MTLSFKELDGSPVESFSADGMTARRRLVVAWEDRHTMVGQLLGSGYALGGSAPLSYPGRSGIVATDVNVEPWPASPDNQGAFDNVATQLNNYSGKLALVTVDYELLDTVPVYTDLPEPEPNTVLTYRMELGGEYLRHPGHNLRWQSDSSLPVPPESVPTLRIPVIEHHVTWHRVSNPPWSAIRQITGAVNSSAFLGAPDETLLFDGATAKKQFLGINGTGVATYGWRITYIFREKAVKADGYTYGWNHRYRPLPTGSPGWDRLIDGYGRRLYAQASFIPLFQFAP